MEKITISYCLTKIQDMFEYFNFSLCSASVALYIVSLMIFISIMRLHFFFISDSSSGGDYLGVHMTSKLIRLESHDDQNVGNEPEDL